ncbi:hypothetical protein GOP47_0002478 [Adiantum capillus-veneris]|uniref:Uncharacterized protein n=1 Tax=Adiantum capillus-veneris TaxID=13818 RepID=A0A9D4ZRN5_ADICA|nr:hypothetical protein GOP47_0002478 [Adiantum capillus-veneris]
MHKKPWNNDVGYCPCTLQHPCFLHPYTTPGGFFPSPSLPSLLTSFPSSSWQLLPYIDYRKAALHFPQMAALHLITTGGIPCFNWQPSTSLVWPPRDPFSSLQWCQPSQQPMAAFPYCFRRPRPPLLQVLFDALLQQPISVFSLTSLSIPFFQCSRPPFVARGGLSQANPFIPLHTPPQFPQSSCPSF